MKAEKIEHHYETLQSHGFDGRALLELKYLLTSPQQLSQVFANFQEVCKEMGIEKIGEILKLSSAIRKL